MMDPDPSNRPKKEPYCRESRRLDKHGLPVYGVILVVLWQGLDLEEFRGICMYLAALNSHGRVNCLMRNSLEDVEEAFHILSYDN